MVERLPDDKPADLRELLSELSCCTQTTQRKLDHFLGKLSFASSVFVPGRTFTRRLWDINKRFSHAKPYFRITLTGIPAAGTIGTASPGHCNPPPSPGLMQEVADLAAMAIAPTTRRTYTTGERKFTQFCALQRWTSMPATDTMPSCVAAHLTQSVQPQTIHVYMAAVRNMHLEAGFRDPTMNALLPPRVMQGIKRTATDPAIQRTRLPITIDLLRKLTNQLSLDRRRHQQDKGMLKAAMVLAFFGFLRCAEFTAPPAGFDPATHATRQDVTLDVTLGRTCIRFHIKQSKTDQLRQGHADNR